METIITHSGSAHADELMAISLIMGSYPDQEFKIFRRDPEETELFDPSVWVIDVGQQYDPTRRNFDHHQYKGGKAAFRLIADHFGIDELAASVFGWWDVSNNIDVHGPTETAKILECDPSVIFKIWGGLQTGLTSLFEKNPGILIPILREIGIGLIQQIGLIIERLELLDQKMDIRMYKDKIVLIHEVKNTPVLGLQQWKDRNYKDACISICPDDRGSGWTLYRFNDHPAVNFYELNGHEKITFAHKGGFIAKTKEISLEEAINLAYGSIK